MSNAQPMAMEIPALGVGTIFTRTFAILFRRIGWFFVLALAPAIAIEILDRLISDLIDFPNLDASGFLGATMAYAGISMLVSAIGASFATALIAQAAYDTALGRRARIGHYIGRTLRHFPVIAVLAVGLGIANALATMALIAPGIWLMGLWSAVVPAIVIERCGFDAVRRSHGLTRGYRWQAAGALILVWTIIVVIAGAVTVPVLYGFSLFGAEALDRNRDLALIAGSVLLATLQLALTSIATALIYARLREIKEGAPVETLAEVFD